MRILVVADDLNDSDAVEAMLMAEGHDVVCCADEFGGPCKGLDHVESCPLERRVDLAVVARSGNTRRGLGEMGAFCAHRHRVPVVEIDPSVPSDQPVEALHALGERAVCHAYERAVIGELEERGLADGVFVNVERRGAVPRVVATLDAARSAASSEEEVAWLANRIGAAARVHDRFAPTIDVVVRRS